MPGVLKFELRVPRAGLVIGMKWIWESVMLFLSKEPAPMMSFALVAIAGILSADWCFGGVSDDSLLSHSNGLVARHAAMFCGSVAGGVWVVQRRRRYSHAAVFFTALFLHLERDCFSKERAFWRSLPDHASAVCRLTGEVASVPRLFSEARKAEGCQFRFKVHELEMEESCLVGGFDVLVYLQASPPRCGDWLSFCAQVRKCPQPRNPGQFDAASFYRREGLWVQAVVPRGVSLKVLQKESGLTFVEGVERLRFSLSEHLRIGLEDRGQTHALLSSMVLGVHSDSLLEARDSFVKTGTLHLFAVSGLNMTMLSTMLIVALHAFGATGVLADLAVFCIVIVYAVVTGLGPSSLRAVVMGAMVMVAAWISRQALLLNSLGAAALGCLLFDTNVLFRVGFQLSFGLVFGLAVVGRRLGAVLSRVFNPDGLVPRALWKDWQWRRIKYWRPCGFALAASVSSWVSILPWSLFFLHQLTPVSLLVNLVVIPIAFLNLALGFTSLLCAPLLGFQQFLGMPVGFSRSLVAGVNACNGWIADCLLRVVEGASALPCSNFWLRDPLLRIPEFCVLDVGEGGAIFLSDGFEQWLVDCGSGVSAKSVVVPALRCYGVNALDGLILSHGDSAHLGGADFLENRIRIGAVMHSCLGDRSLIWSKFEQSWLSKGNQVCELAAGDRLRTKGGACIEVLYPPADLRVPVADDRCLVLRWRSSSGSILYTADSGFTAERWLLDHRRNEIKADVWVRGVHSSDVSGTDEFIAAIGPQLVVVSESRSTSPGSGIGEWAAHCRDLGLEVWLQRDCGAVEGFGASGGMRCSGFLGESCFLRTR